MGREASHLTLEVALRTMPNLTFIGEEVKQLGRTLAQLTEQIADLVVRRRQAARRRAMRRVVCRAVLALPCAAPCAGALCWSSVLHAAPPSAPRQVRRSEAGLDFGVILIPEGLIDFVPEVSNLIGELNDVMRAPLEPHVPSLHPHVPSLQPNVPSL